MIPRSPDALSGSQYFSTLGLNSGYRQVKVDPKDIDKTAFITCQKAVLIHSEPFGLCNAMATSKSLMELVFNWKDVPDVP